MTVGIRPRSGVSAERQTMQKPTPSATSSLPQIIMRRRLVCIPTVQAALDCDREFALGLLDDGTLRGFNLALDPCCHPELRILASDLAAFQQRQRKPQAGFGEALKVVFPMLAEALPGSVATIKVVTLRRRLGVKHTHIYNLIQAGCLQLKPGASPRQGSTGSPEVLFSSVVRFLRERFAA